MDKFFGCVITLVVVVALDLLVAWAFQGLWNELMPMIFHLPTLTYWQAFGFIMLLGIVSSIFRNRSNSGKGN